MNPIVTPKLTVSFAVDLEVSYDSFSGKTPEELAASLEDELHTLLMETSPDVVGVYSSITHISTND